MLKYTAAELRNMYKWKIIDENYLDRAVGVAWITQAERDAIVQEG